MGDVESEPTGGIRVTVVEGLGPRDVRQREVALPAHFTVAQAIERLGLARDGWVVAVWGRVRHDDWPLEDGDRLEVLRALTADPMEARRRRHAHQRRMKEQAKKVRSP